MTFGKKMGKRLKKSPQGQASIKSFFSPIGGKPAGSDSSKSSEAEEDSDVILTEPDSDSDWEDESKKKKRKKRKRPERKSARKSSSKTEEKSTKELKKEAKSAKKPSKDKDVEIIKVIDEETAAFLRSGIPSATAKAKQRIDTKREEDEATKDFLYFPSITHTPVDQVSTFPDHSDWERKLGLKFQEDSVFCNGISCDEGLNGYEDTKKFPSFRNDDSKARSVCCDFDSVGLDNVKVETVIDGMPWIEKYGVIEKSNLAVDEDTIDKVETWLRRWKRDIKDDNGKNRKLLEKVKKKGNDSDFVTSDEDSETRTTGLLLYGPTGSGKTATVVSLAKRMGFKIVEVNFSTARPGKEVLRRVEEATLSHRLESAQTCLLLFEDISLLEPKEDEGFGSAVAQLISSSRRPIVMTMTTNEPASVGHDCDNLLPDSKIEKKGYMGIYFSHQLPSFIVQKALQPILKAEVAEESHDDVIPLLHSIARHAKGDIRKSVNQLQLILSRPSRQFHSYLAPWTDLNFIRKSNSSSKSSTKIFRRIRNSPEMSLEETKLPDESKPNRKSRAEVMKELKTLEEIKNQLSFAVDYDRISKVFNDRLCDESKCNEDFKTGLSIVLRSCFDESLKRALTLHSEAGTSNDSGTVIESEGDFKIWPLLFESEDDVMMERKAADLDAQTEQYCGIVGDLMTCGQMNYENFGCFRTVVKLNKLNAIGAQKRNRRVSNYFNRVPHVVVDQVYETFGFPNEVTRVQCLQLS